MQNCIRGSRPCEEDNERHKTQLQEFSRASATETACGGRLEQQQSRKVALAYGHDSRWRNRSELINGESTPGLSDSVSMGKERHDAYPPSPR